MLTLTLPRPLGGFAAESGGVAGSRPRPLLFDAASWDGFRGELRERFPALADRVLTTTGGLAAGFVLVVNDEALPPGGAARYDLHDGDDLALIAAMAGG